MTYSEQLLDSPKLWEAMLTVASIRFQILVTILVFRSLGLHSHGLSIAAYLILKPGYDASRLIFLFAPQPVRLTQHLQAL